MPQNPPRQVFLSGRVCFGQGASCTVFPIKESGRQKRKSRERCPHRPADLPEDSNFLVQPCQNRPAKFARTSLSAWGLPTPAVAFACIGNVDIQVFSGVGGRLYFIRRLQAVYKPPLKGVTPHGVGRCPQGRGDRSVRGEPPLGGGGVPP